MARHTAVRFALCCLFAAIPASAGTWSTPVILGTSAYSGSIALDSAGNMTGVWYQYTAPNGSQINQVWASGAAFGHPWPAPVNISGPIGVASGNPNVHAAASGNVTAIYNKPSAGATYVDKPFHGNWGTPGATNGINQFFAGNERGDQGLAWGTGGARATASTVAVVQRPAGGTWSAATTIATGVHLNFDGAVMAPDGTMALAWESFDSVCTSRTCKTSNWVLHVSTRASGAAGWIDSGPLAGLDTNQHFAQLAADGAGNLGAIARTGTTMVSLVRHGSVWTAPVVVPGIPAVAFYTGTGRDNRVYKSDFAGHATVVSWSDPTLLHLVAGDGNLATNTWGPVRTISGPDQFPGYFDFAMSESGTAIVLWNLQPFNGGNTVWRAATRSGPGVAWNAPATVGTSLQGGGVPESVAVNGAGQAAVVFHGYAPDLVTFIQYTNTYQP